LRDLADAGDLLSRGLRSAAASLEARTSRVDRGDARGEDTPNDPLDLHDDREQA